MKNRRNPSPGITMTEWYADVANEDWANWELNRAGIMHYSGRGIPTYKSIVKSNPLIKADANTAAVGLFEPEGEDFKVVLFDRVDYDKYRKTGSKTMLERSIIGFLDIGPWRPDYKLGENINTKRPPGAMKVSGSVSVQGYGPLLYAIAVKLLERRRRGMLFPGSSLSAHAKAFWSRFPKGYMEPLPADKFAASFGVSPTALSQKASGITEEEISTLVDAGDDLFYRIYNDMDPATGKMDKQMPRQNYLASLARKAAAVPAPLPMAANPFDHFPRKNRR
jgi:hypothetical protein